jgi:hypothetical protein
MVSSNTDHQVSAHSRIITPRLHYFKIPYLGVNYVIEESSAEIFSFFMLKYANYGKTRFENEVYSANIYNK